MEGNIFYNYVYLDPRKPGNYNYGELHFDYEPFYIGKGSYDRLNAHLYENEENACNKKKYNKIQKIIKVTDNNPIILKLFENLEENNALNLEKMLIKLIGRDDLGMGPLTNLTDGGDDNHSYKYSKIVFQYDLNGNFIKEYRSIKFAFRVTGILGISECCRGINKTAGNHFWSYKELTKEEIQEHLDDINYHKGCIHIFKYDLINGKLVEKYKSIKYAGIMNNIHAENIIASLKNDSKTADNHFWSYKELTKEEIDARIYVIKFKKTVSKSICKFEKINNIFIEKYESISSASKINNLGRGHIRSCCNGYRKSAGGFIWRYEYMGNNNL